MKVCLQESNTGDCCEGTGLSQQVHQVSLAVPSLPCWRSTVPTQGTFAVSSRTSNGYCPRLILSYSSSLPCEICAESLDFLID